MCIQHRITSQAQRPSGRSPTKGATTRGWSESGWCSLAAFHCPTRNMDLPGSQVDDELCSLLYSGTLLKDSTEERRKLQDSALVARFSPSWPGKRPIQSIALAVDISWPATYATQWQFQSPTWVVAAARHRILVNFWDLDLLFFWPGHLMKGHWFRPRRGQRSKFQTLQPTIWPPRVLFCGSLPKCDFYLSYFCRFFIASPKLFGSCSPSDFNPGTSSKDQHQSLR